VAAPIFALNPTGAAFTRNPTGEAFSRHPSQLPGRIPFTVTRHVHEHEVRGRVVALRPSAALPGRMAITVTWHVSRSRLTIC
jgi:hypothetical protein